jgi:hypothetical protein
MAGKRAAQQGYRRNIWVFHNIEVASDYIAMQFPDNVNLSSGPPLPKGSRPSIDKEKTAMMICHHYMASQYSSFGCATTPQ